MLYEFRKAAVLAGDYEVAVVGEHAEGMDELEDASSRVGRVVSGTG